MKMAKATEKDIEAAGELLGILDTIDPVRGKPRRSGRRPGAHMTIEQFAALAALLRLRGGSSQEAARLVLVEGVRPSKAARQAGTTQQAVSNVLASCRRGMALAAQAAPAHTWHLEKYIIHEIRDGVSVRKGEVFEGTLRAAKLKATRGQVSYRTVMKITDEEGRAVATKDEQTGKWY